ncbi:MAG: amidohydrolase family protein [Deltaproteobacteria bacterium]|nr:amidohydrolase family protein [Deltaproteobacteria bacterium]
MWLLLLASLALAAPLARAERTPVPTRITEVWVLDHTGARTGPHDVVLRDGTIESVGPVGANGQVPVERVVDGSGHTLMPGLIDVHVHLGSLMAVPGRPRLPSPRRNLDAFLYAGVTTVVDLAEPRDALERLQQRIGEERWDGPTIFGTGRPFAAPGGHPKSTVRAMFPGLLVKWSTARIAWEVETSAEVDAAFAQQGQTPFTKVMLESLPPGAPTLSDEALERIRTGSTAFDARLLAHVGRSVDVDRALALPVDALAHTPWADPLTGAQIALLHELRIPVMPTLAVWETVRKMAKADPWLGPLERETLPGSGVRDLDLPGRRDPPGAGHVGRSWPHAQTGPRRRNLGEQPVHRPRGALRRGAGGLGGGPAPGAGRPHPRPGGRPGHRCALGGWSTGGPTPAAYGGVVRSHRGEVTCTGSET